MRKGLTISVACVLLSACTGHQYEPREPGVTFSGETRAGVTYKDGKITPDQDTTLTISVGGTI